MAPDVRPVVLCIIDGWGLAEDTPGNALACAETPHWDRLVATAPWSRVEASGAAVGLPEGQMGNSEVGHLNIGAGRIVHQDIVRIDRAIETGEFAKNDVFRGIVERTKAAGKTLHLLGLTGPGGVHSHDRHMYALLRLSAELGHPDVQVHAVLDGRDTPPRSAERYLADLQNRAEQAGAHIGTVMGRYWAMDRDQRWDRTEKAYRCLVHGEGHRAADAASALAAGYARDENDEFVEPTMITDGSPISPGDGFVFVNFRPDRARQLTRALADPGFSEFDVKPLGLDYVCMTQYHGSFPEFTTIAYTPERPELTLGEHIAELGLTQLRIAETEKYAHVTYFFSGGREAPFTGEERILVPSPQVDTYDSKPDMSTGELTDRLVEALERKEPPDLVVLNIAAPDMVGHTGALAAARRACEAVDSALGRLDAAVRDAGGALLVTADHGNVEEMLDATGGAVTKHTTNPVPLLLSAAPGVLPARTTLADGILADVAPTVLDLMGLPKPPVMDRPSLLERAGEAVRSPQASLRPGR